MYEAFYGFREKPFTLTPDPRYFYPSRAHREALDHLLYGIREREGFIVITGDVGTGKTTLCRAILLQMEEGTKTAVILNPVLSEDELLRAILRDFGLTAAGRTKNELIAELNEFLLQCSTAGRRAVLIVDEAQNLSHALLEQIRLLSNLETERDKLIQIILVGQLQLLAHLASPELKQLNQRVSVRYCLRPLSFQEMSQYVYHRLMVAGGATGVSFSAGALRAIYGYSQGIPRLVNLAADRALLQGYTDQAREITRRRAQAAIRSLASDSGAPAARTFARRAIYVGALVALLAGVALTWFVAGKGTAATTAAAVTPAPAALAAPTPAPAAVPPGATPSDASPATPLSVLVGSYATESDARAIERRLAAGGYAAAVARNAQAGAAGAYSVLVGRYAEVADAERARDALIRDAGFSGATIVRTRADSSLP